MKFKAILDFECDAWHIIDVNTGEIYCIVERPYVEESEKKAKHLAALLNFSDKFEISTNDLETNQFDNLMQC